ncbi:hypothetical protein CRUP_017395, partial [Coryphaenoides rupestris]
MGGAAGPPAAPGASLHRRPPGGCALSDARQPDPELLSQRDLAAIPRDKAILEVERPDLMTYRPHLSFSSLDPPRRERSLSPTSSPPSSPETGLSTIEWSKKKLEEEDDEFEDLTEDAKTLQEQELVKIKSNMGRLILKEEKDKAINFRRKTQSLPDRTHMHTSGSTLGSHSPSHSPSRSGLTRVSAPRPVAIGV